MATINLDIITPEKVIYSKSVDMVDVPGADGDMGILQGHAPIISNLRSGVLRVHKGDKIIDRILIVSGVVEITGENCSVLATHAHNFADVTKEDIKERLAAIKKIHDKAVDEKEKMKLLTDTEVLEQALDSMVKELDKL